MARSFNGSSQYLSGSRDFSAYSRLTVGGKVYFNSKPSPYGIIWEFGAATGNFTFYWNNNINALKVSCTGNVGSSDAEYTSTTVNNGQWYDFITTFDFAASTNEANLYVDGVAQTAGARPANANNTGAFGSSTFIVAARSTPQYYHPGLIERLWVYAGIVNADQAASIARGVSPVVALGAGLLHYWPLWGNDSPEPDYCGNLALSLTNTPTQAAGPSANRPFDGANWWPGAFTGTSPPPPPPSNTNYLMPMLGVGDD